MSLWDKLWQGIAETIKLNDKVDRLGAAIARHQERIGDLSERVTRLETQFDTTAQIARMLRGREDR